LPGATARRRSSGTRARSPCAFGQLHAQARRAAR